MRCYNLGPRLDERWTWAQHLRPPHNEVSVPCDRCGHGRLYQTESREGYTLYPERPFVADVVGGQAYPDVLGCGASALLIVSDRVLRDWEELGVRGYHSYPVQIGHVRSLTMKLKPRPLYHHIQVTGRCELDTGVMGIDIQFSCSQCDYRRIRPFSDFPFVIRGEPWLEQDLFVDELFPRVIFCSERIFRAAAERQRTNFRFRLPENVNRGQYHDIEYLAAT